MPVEIEDEDYSPSELASLAAAAGSPGTLIHITVPLALAGERFDQALAQLFPDFSRSRLAAMIKDGGILLDGVRAQPKTRLLGGENIAATLAARPEDTAFVAEAVPLAVLYEDEAIIVIDKPPGLVVHPAAGNWQGTILNGLLFRNPQVARLPRAGIVHRLDKDTSGVMVAAKTEAAQLHLVRQLQARTMKRIYLALVRGFPPDHGKVDAPIGRHARERTRMAIVGEEQGGKAAVTHYRALKRLAEHTLLECRLETGRTHQIRVHMQAVGYPIEGDAVYQGQTGKFASITPELRRAMQYFGRQALHARSLTLEHPVTGEAQTFEAPIPDDLAKLIAIAEEFA